MGLVAAEPSHPREGRQHPLSLSWKEEKPEKKSNYTAGIRQLHWRCLEELEQFPGVEYINKCSSRWFQVQESGAGAAGDR